MGSGWDWMDIKAYISSLPALIPTFMPSFDNDQHLPIPVNPS